MLTLDHISKAYGGTNVVDDVSLTIPAATTVVLIGPSGCGKSTLLRLIAGLVSPDRGTVAVGDELLTAQTIGTIRDQLGYVIQDGGLFPHLTAEQNVTIRARQNQWPRDRVERRVRELAKLTHFPVENLSRFPVQLSGGQRQRVGIMRALMTDPAVLLLDEPLAALDPMIRRELQHDLREIFRTLQKTVLFVTHDLHEAEWFADRIVLLRAGRIEQDGTAAEFASQPASEFVSRFVSAQRMAPFGAAS